MAQVILFDVNETLLDLAALDPQFEQLMGNGALRRDWFQTLKEIWLVSLVVGRYADFSTLGRAALEMTAEREGIVLSEEAASTILADMRELPAHPEVTDALQQLSEGDFRLAALTNGTLSAAQAQLEYAGLTPFFEQIFSADEVQRLKPAPEPYRMAAERLGVKLEEVCMVAAHDWDVTGAKAAGCKTAFIARPGQVLNPAGVKPDLVGSDLQEISRQLLAERSS